MTTKYDEQDFQLNRATYEWSVRVFATFEKVLSANIKMHHSEEQLAQGSIFLFNHFARFETFIPQYLIHKKTGALCRSVAAADFFVEDATLSEYLRSVGAVPNDYPKLLPFLAAEILRGRKVIVFPEGGMIKDRRVLDHRGHYSIFSPTAGERRKHHTGAAVLALMVEAFKTGILAAEKRDDTQLIESWAKRLKLESEGHLLAAAREPTLIIPANITFFPIRVSDNLLRKGVELFNRRLSRHHSEELLIEGNILLKNTDMDIRLEDPVLPSEHWHWWEKKLAGILVKRAESMDTFFGLGSRQGHWTELLMRRSLRKKSLDVRNQYMYRVYAGATINLSHLASRLIFLLLDAKQSEITHRDFHVTLYLVVKNAHRSPKLHLHRSLLNPNAYEGLLDLNCPSLNKFLETAKTMGLIEHQQDVYRFLPKLREQYEFHEIRVENLVAVYANEALPITEVTTLLQHALKQAKKADSQSLAKHRFDDELIAFQWDKAHYNKAHHLSINKHETATQPPEPYLLLPKKARSLGILLVHGFLATPSELKNVADTLHAAGYASLGVRLKGHGTSPWDLRDRKWTDWFDSVRRGYSILSAFVDKICIVGFSCGGALSLKLASERPDGLAGVAAVSPPLKFTNKNFVFVPLVHGANQLTRWIPAFEGIMPFRRNESEHPDINYQNIPLHGLYQLRLFLDDYVNHLDKITCPTRILQGTEDPVVDPQSAELIFEKLTVADKSIHWVESDRHGILNESIGDTREILDTFIRQCDN